MKLMRNLILKIGNRFYKRVITTSMAFNNLIVTSLAKCYIY